VAVLSNRCRLLLFRNTRVNMRRAPLSVAAEFARDLAVSSASMDSISAGGVSESALTSSALRSTIKHKSFPQLSFLLNLCQARRGIQGEADAKGSSALSCGFGWGMSCISAMIRRLHGLIGISSDGKEPLNLLDDPRCKWFCCECA
jgi:hypothetical protein